MIKNDKQYKITKSKLREFRDTLESIKDTEQPELLKKIMSDSIKSQIETFEKEIVEYENLLKNPNGIILSSIEKLPEALIKVRIARGLTHAQLAEKLGLKEQQIQRYESENYESANFERLINIAKTMDVSFNETRLFLKREELKVKGYNPEFIREATNKLHSKRLLLSA